MCAQVLVLSTRGTFIHSNCEVLSICSEMVLALVQKWRLLLFRGGAGSYAEVALALF